MKVEAYQVCGCLAGPSSEGCPRCGGRGYVPWPREAQWWRDRRPAQLVVALAAVVALAVGLYRRIR